MPGLLQRSSSWPPSSHSPVIYKGFEDLPGSAKLLSFSLSRVAKTQDASSQSHLIGFPLLTLSLVMLATASPIGQRKLWKGTQAGLPRGLQVLKQGWISIPIYQSESGLAFLPPPEQKTTT